MASATTIAGRYEIEGRLGVGGMSTVHLAFDQRLERNVALKLLAEHLADDPAFVSRFRREALAAARLVHPNIVQVFDFGFDEGQHQHFIVMEHVPGHSCAELLRDRGHLDVDDAIEIVAQACRGLEYAHRHGVVHRDVKPGNLLVSDSDVVKLADFGIARATDQSSITQVGSVLGTAAYLAPEQARGEEAGPQSDIYSLGVVTYQLMSGRLPYEASSLSELALMQQREAPVPLDRLNDRVPPELARAVALALSIEKEARPEDALSFGEVLRAGAHGIEPLPGPTAAATSATRVLGGRDAATSATRVAAPRTTPEPATQSTPARSTRRLEPQPYQTGAYARAPYDRTDRAAERRGRGRRAGRRFAAFLAILCLFAAAVIVAVVIATSTSNTAVQARKTIANDVNSAIQSVQNQINQYTK
jgi:eukaryotic-like serine/threonine-protein kinase